MTDKQSTTPLYVVIVLSMFVWGVTWPSGKILSQYGATADIVFIRYIIVVLSLIPLLVLLRTNLKIKKEGILPVLLAGALMAIYGYLFLLGVKKGLSGAGGVLTTTLNPIMAYALGLMLSRKTPSLKESLGLVLGIIAGSILLKIWSNLEDIFNSGNLYFLLAALSWALMSKITSQANKYGNAFSFSFWIYLVTLACLAPLVDFAEIPRIIATADHIFWINIIYNGLVSTALATSAYIYATAKLGAEKASSFIFLVPTSAALSAWIILDEYIQTHTLIGGALGIIAVYIINYKAKTTNGRGTIKSHGSTAA
ncbi:MAG TPA: DMT family transporter [Cytophagales bacterium]|nr:DMT family transporter [Cytophagales bacterium]